VLVRLQLFCTAYDHLSKAGNAGACAERLQDSPLPERVCARAAKDPYARETLDAPASEGPLLV
jgi:hypothetical protein